MLRKLAALAAAVTLLLALTAAGRTDEHRSLRRSRPTVTPTATATATVTHTPVPLGFSLVLPPTDVPMSGYPPPASATPESGYPAPATATPHWMADPVLATVYAYEKTVEAIIALTQATSFPAYP